MNAPRTKGAQIEALRESLLDRDVAVLNRVAELKFVSGAQLEVLHFEDHANSEAAARARRRVLQRLVRDQLLTRIERRIGGIRSGSSGYVYCLSDIGKRVLDIDGPRRRFREPTLTFLTHTLAIAQVVVDLTAAARRGEIELLNIESEPRCWRSFGSLGGTQLVRPDLFVVLADGEYEYRWFIEVDLGTETTPRRIDKCKQYQAYYAAGIEQAKHDVFPKVCWSMKSRGDADRLADAIAAPRSRIEQKLFDVTTHDRLIEIMRGGARRERAPEPHHRRRRP